MWVSNAQSVSGSVKDPTLKGSQLAHDIKHKLFPMSEDEENINMRSIPHDVHTGERARDYSQMADQS